MTSRYNPDFQSGSLDVTGHDSNEKLESLDVTGCELKLAKPSPKQLTKVKFKAPA